MEVELWLSFYHVTPSFFFDNANRKQYPSATSCMTFDRYRSILAALNTACRPETDGLNQWAAPFSPDRDTTYAAELIRRLCADIGFVPGTTIASLDDDLIRLRSASVDDVGLAHIRNPKKGYGPVQHGVVSLATGIFLGGHVAARGESTVDIVRILQRSFQQSRATLVEQPFSRDELTKKKCAELKSMCRDALLPVSGRKSHLIDRLLGASPADEPENDGSIEHARFIIGPTLLSAWFMAPFSTQDTKIGSANEDNIAEHVTFFLDKHSPYHVEGLKAYGLLCRRGMPVAAFSPDNVASVLNIQRGRFHAIMEYKTRTTARTVQREQALAASWGSFTSHSFLTNRTLCTTYKAYQKHKQNLPSFAAFCREAAVALSQRPKAARPLSIVDGNTRQTSTSDLNGTFVYKKRVHFETEKEWIDLRLSKTEAHIAVSIRYIQNNTCVLTGGAPL
eukprot:jgi/Phyca11/115778/e_gw1.29.308.1